ncbi:MAG: polysaccharide biosynthesis/export family protein [Thermodesulfobacteriota bacterium]|nr:polysaccharide biosynthesis/export family protein [Thermodesulfobacteriota bacterium]
MKSGTEKKESGPRRRHIAGLFLSLLIMSCSMGPFYTDAPPPQVSMPDQIPAPDFSVPYTLGAGDEIEIKFYFHPELNEKTTIRPDGRISLVLVDEVKASGLTPEKLDIKLTRLYGQKLDRVDLTVIVRGYSSQNVFIDGEIKTPQSLPLRGEMTVLQAIISSGIKETADMRSVLLMRAVSREEVKVFQLDLATPSKWSETNVFVKPLDIIYVPRSYIASTNLFVKQYLSNMVPDFIRLTFPLTYNLGGNSNSTRTVVISESQ